MSALLLDAAGAPEETWRYAAWIAIDFRLVLFAALISALTAAGLTALLVRGPAEGGARPPRVHDYVAVWLIGFVGFFAMTVFFMNEVAQHPVFVVESLFPFP